MSARDLYAAAADPEGSYASAAAVEALRQELTAPARDDGYKAGDDLAALPAAAARWAETERDRFRALAAGAGVPRALLAERAALGCAPLGLVAGAWLQWLSAPGNAHDETVLAVLALYASDVGAGRPAATRGDAFRQLLGRLHAADNAASPTTLVHDHRVADHCFYAPSVLLAIGRRPDDFLPELLGADICLRSAGLLPPLEIVRTSGVDADWIALDPGRARVGDEPGGTEQSLAATARLLATSVPRTEARLVAGFEWVFASLRRWCQMLRHDLRALGDPAREMEQLLVRRSRQGAVYHKGFKIGGRTLSEWFAASDRDGRPLMHALARSRLVKPGRSDLSPLVNGLVSPEGPMFRVFSPEDLAIIRRWIDDLPERTTDEGDESDEPRPSPKVRHLAVPRRALTPPSPADDAPPSSLRDAYQRLQTRTSSPALLAWAEQYVHGWLARAGRGVRADATQLPPERSAAGLRPWLLDRHDRAAGQFEADRDVPLPSREALVDETIQTSALTLIDGAWLQGFTEYGLASTEWGRFLFATYWDELGNGLAELNHPRIYRDLLEQMGVDLPPTHSQEYARSPRLRDRSFELPVYWLSIGRFPRSFMPEILGLNVAMELSGVGGGYRRARMALKHHGFSTRFVDIHNTIDNVATGHSAWAADAVDRYLDEVATTGGPEAEAGAWQRVRTGFVSLNPPSDRRARLAQRRGQARHRRPSPTRTPAGAAAGHD